jgi:DeoR/GlpR family transcriptional regulator of sugar metabolism
MTARPVLTRPVTVRKEAPVSRYRRWNELLELLATSGWLQVEDAAKALGVSAATVRRDVDELAGQQMLTRIRGGAVATFARIFTAREVDVLVTDAGIAAGDRARLEDEGVEVVLA